jgi:hypothetical protein
MDDDSERVWVCVQPCECVVEGEEEGGGHGDERALSPLPPPSSLRKLKLLAAPFSLQLVNDHERTIVQLPTVHSIHARRTCLISTHSLTQYTVHSVCDCYS